MIIVLPTCIHDYKLALLNLEHALRLEEGHRTAFQCVLAVELKDPVEVIRLVDAAEALFTSVKLFHVEPYRGDPAWPCPQNFMWQRVARWLSHAGNLHKWFWWEPDCVPLEKGWMDKLAKAVESQPRPIAAAEAWQEGTGHYPAGCAVYPPKVSRYFKAALLTVTNPWDVIAQQEDGVLAHTHNISNLICHRTGREGTRFTSMADVRRLIPEGSILYHKCKDGSLAAVLAGRQPEPVGDGSIERSSIHTQAVARGWQSGTFAFPYERDTVHFNPSIVRRSDDGLLLITRRSRQIPGGSHSDLTIWRVRESSMTVYGMAAPKLTTREGEQWEDPKAVLSSDGVLLIACANWRHHDNKPIRQALLRVSADLQTAEAGAPLNHPDPSRHEKNWAPFISRENHACFVYSINPHVVTWLDKSEHRNSTLPLAWPFGEPRGGTPPVLVGGEFITFFHSSLPWRKPKRRYYMGAYAFESRPPFRITRMTVEPLLVGSEEDPRVLGGPLVVFPNGAVLSGPDSYPSDRMSLNSRQVDGRAWTLSLGVNDEQCAWLRIPHSDIDRALVPVELHPELIKESV